MTRHRTKPRSNRALKPDPNHHAPDLREGEEGYCGFFKINVSALLEVIETHPEEFEQIIVPVKELHWGAKDLTEEYIEEADLSRPIILAEIPPDRAGFDERFLDSEWEIRGYTMIDGNHRLEKAKRHGVTELPAYLVRMEQHTPFMFGNFDRYVDYWNGKLIEREDDAERSSRYVKE
jgi:hypothetical protein